MTWIQPRAPLAETGRSGGLASRSWVAYPDHGPRLLRDHAAALASADVILVGTARPGDPPARRLALLGPACSLVTRAAVRGQTILVTDTCYVGCTRDLLIEPLGERGLADGEDINVELCPSWQTLAEAVEPEALTRIARETAKAGVVEDGSPFAWERRTPEAMPARDRAVECLEAALLHVHRPHPLQLRAKRAIDVVAAGIGLLVLAPIFALIALAILLDDGRPILFGQTRIGRNGRSFRFLKFRTMVDGAERHLADVLPLNGIHGPAFQVENDPRVTRLGSFLRRSSLDELPQLWNVLRGDMSLVGPRPAPLCEVSDYLPWHRRRLYVKPGITGLAQVTERSYREFDRKACLDARYVDEWSLRLDLSILLRTVPLVLRMSGR